MHQLASLSFLTTLSIAVAFGLSLTILSMVLLRIFNSHMASEPLSVPVPPFVGSVTTAWALAMGFVAADIWSVNTRAENWASQERSAINRLVGTASADALDMPLVMQALRDYTTVSTEREWGASANSEPSIEVDEVLQRIRLEIVAKASTNTPAPLIGKMISDFDLLQDARDARLGIGAHSINDYKWYLVLVLTVLSLVTIAAIHADRPAAGKRAIIIFSTVAAVSLWILILHANPYRGVEGIKPQEVNSFPLHVADAAD